MKKLSLILGLLTLSCTNPNEPTVIPVQQREIIVIQSGTGEVSLSCASVDRVVLVLPSSLAVGTTFRLDATPKDNLGQPRSTACNEKSGVVWTSNSDTCTLSDYTNFTPNVLGVRPGQCVVSATVSSVSNQGSFPVQ